MNNHAVQILEYDKIINNLMEYAVSDRGGELIRNLKPSINIAEIENRIRETTEARAIIMRNSSVPIHSLKGIDSIVTKLEKGSILLPEELSSVWEFLGESRKLKRFMSDKGDMAPMVSSFALSIYELTEVENEIERCIQKGRVDNRASSELLKLRKKILILEDRIKSRLESYLKSPNYQSYIQDSVVSLRNGRYVIPIRSEYKKSFEGSILDSSASGSTVFIEPAEVKKLHDELNLLRISEDNEVYRILSSLTVLVESYIRELKINIEIMANYDFLFAKARYSKALDANPVKLNNQKYINIIRGRHPLIGNSAVPLDFTVGSEYRGLIITGPNTGGKTVALKTVGLLTMMAQSGLHVPADPESELSVFIDILADIGDGQSIEQSLSTFSAHIKNIISIMECADSDTLVIMDELGAGTDPGEGVGIAVAVLEDVYNKGATILATTHYSEIKDFANSHGGFENGCMEFDINTLKPMYKLNIGRAGESNALLIALKLGMNRQVIERAHEISYKEKKAYEKVTYTGTNNEVKNEEVTRFHQEQVKKLQEDTRINKIIEKQEHTQAFKIGDCVYISTLNRTGIVYELENSRGEVGVMYEKKKIKVNRKRLSLYIESKELYPDNYDFDIIFDTKDNRKKRHLMDRKHVEGIEIQLTKND